MSKVRITLEANSLEMYDALCEHMDKSQEILCAPVISMLLGKRVDEKERLRLSMLKITVVSQEYVDDVSGNQT